MLLMGNSKVHIEVDMLLLLLMGHAGVHIEVAILLLMLLLLMVGCVGVEDGAIVLFLLGEVRFDDDKVVLYASAIVALGGFRIEEGGS
jgi:hypothetical protein